MFNELKNLCEQFNIPLDAAREVCIEAIYKEAIERACFESEFGVEFENERHSIINIGENDSELLIQVTATDYKVVQDYDELCIFINKLVWNIGNNKI